MNWISFITYSNETNTAAENTNIFITDNICFSLLKAVWWPITDWVMISCNAYENICSTNRKDVWEHKPDCTSSSVQ